MIDFLKVWNSLFVNFSIFCSSIVMTFFNFWRIFFHVWTRIFRNSTFDSSNTCIIDFSFFSKNSSRLRRFDCVINSFSNWSRFSRLIFSTNVAKRRDFSVVLTGLWLFESLPVLARGLGFWLIHASYHVVIMNSKWMKNIWFI